MIISQCKYEVFEGGGGRMAMPAVPHILWDVTNYKHMEKKTLYLYNEKGNIKDCNNYSGIKLM